MKTYIFKDEGVPEEFFTIHIKASNYENAYKILVSYVKHPADYKCLNP